VKVGKTKRCVTMFSGGRDSSLAALRLADSGIDQILVTVSSNHLVGLPTVEERLAELSEHLPIGTIWANVRQPPAPLADEAFRVPTCFPCHKAYTTVAVQMAAAYGADSVAFGYASYQGDWPEQRPEAVSFLSDTLRSIGLSLLTPVYDLVSKEAAREELRSRGLVDSALEQKCLFQIHHRALTPGEYAFEFQAWTTALVQSLSAHSATKPDVLREVALPLSGDA
jgi:hypothetical protein